MRERERENESGGEKKMHLMKNNEIIILLPPPPPIPPFPQPLIPSALAGVSLQNHRHISLWPELKKQGCGGEGGGCRSCTPHSFKELQWGGKGLTVGMFAELHTYQSVSWGLPSLLGARLVQHVWTTPPPWCLSTQKSISQHYPL